MTSLVKDLEQFAEHTRKKNNKKKMEEEILTLLAEKCKTEQLNFQDDAFQDDAKEGLFPFREEQSH